MEFHRFIPCHRLVAAPCAARCWTAACACAALDAGDTPTAVECTAPTDTNRNTRTLSARATSDATPLTLGDLPFCDVGRHGIAYATRHR